MARVASSICCSSRTGLLTSDEPDIALDSLLAVAIEVVLEVVDALFLQPTKCIGPLGLSFPITLCTVEAGLAAASSSPPAKIKPTGRGQFFLFS